jgi:hypothetical protein
MHELEKKNEGMREKLEELFHRDLAKETLARSSSGEQQSVSELKKNENIASDGGGSSKKRTKWSVSKKELLLAFGLGVGAPFIINFACATVVPWFANSIDTTGQSITSGRVDVTTIAGVSPSESTHHQALTIIPGLSATHSTLTGIVDPRTLSASYYWSMTLNNHTSNHRNQEAKMNLTLPKGAVVSRATLWINGRSEEAAFNATNAVHHAYNWITVQHRDPLLVTQSSDGHILVQMSPVPANGQEVRIQLGITAPMDVKNSNTLRLQLPQVSDSNFSISKQDVHLQSPTPLYANSAKFTNTGSSGHFIFKGNVEPAELANLQIPGCRNL